MPKRTMKTRMKTPGIGEISTASVIEGYDDFPLRYPVGRQRIPLKPDQAHAARLLARQNGLDDRRLQQREAQQFVHRRVMQSFALGDVGAAGDPAVVEQLLPVEGPSQRYKHGTVELVPRGAACALPVRPDHHLAHAALADLQRNEGRK
jgi:hypothetical protein